MQLHFPGSWRHRDDRLIFWWNHNGNSDGTSDEKNFIQRRGSSFCHGASKLPYAGAKNVGHLLWDKAKDFLQRAFTVIFMATLVIWFLQTFNTHLSIVTDSKDSILAMLASVVAPIFKPMGLVTGGFQQH